jgi:hypothetical protein
MTFRNKTLFASPVHVAALLREARLAKFDFLAYLLGMALKEARRLADKASEDPG